MFRHGWPGSGSRPAPRGRRNAPRRRAAPGAVPGPGGVARGNGWPFGAARRSPLRSSSSWLIAPSAVPAGARAAGSRLEPARSRRAPRGSRRGADAGRGQLGEPPADAELGRAEAVGGQPAPGEHLADAHLLEVRPDPAEPAEDHQREDEEPGPHHDPGPHPALPGWPGIGGRLGDGVPAVRQWTDAVLVNVAHPPGPPPWPRTWPAPPWRGATARPAAGSFSQVEAPEGCGRHTTVAVAPAPS